MEAELGSNPSFVWHSLLQARELITVGSAWKIGDGETVGIESHKWLPQPPSFKPGADRSLKVCQLFDADTRQWNRPLIQSLFHASTRDDILRIKLGDARTRDKLHWIETKSRTFSVKSAYHVALRLSNAAVGEHSLANQDKGLWNKVWPLILPRKFGTSFGVLALTSSLPESIFSGGKYRSTRNVAFVDNRMRQQAMFFGSVRLLSALGPMSQEKFKSLTP